MPPHVPSLTHDTVQQLLATIYARPDLEPVLESHFGKVTIGISVSQLQDFLGNVCCCSMSASIKLIYTRL
jgi:hypothetical protein